MTNFPKPETVWSVMDGITLAKWAPCHQEEGGTMESLDSKPPDRRDGWAEAEDSRGSRD